MDEEPRGSRRLDGAFDVCRTMLQEEIHAGRNLEALREPLRALSSCAREERIPPERVLVKIKELLHDVTGYDTMPLQARDTVRERLVQMVIAAYYSEGDRS